jgi:hypothetical protein
MSSLFGLVEHQLLVVTLFSVSLLVFHLSFLALLHYLVELSTRDHKADPLAQDGEQAEAEKGDGEVRQQEDEEELCGLVT